MINISVYSGKCDCYDTLVAIHNYTEDDLKNKVEIYVGYNVEPLHIESCKDLIPFYPYLISSAMFNNEKAVIYLSSKSFVDREEEERLISYLQQILKVYNCCKKKKIEFVVEDTVKNVCFGELDKKQITELATRVKKHGKKANIDGIHLTMHEHYRQALVDEMLDHGIDPSKYGYGRFVKK